MCDGHLRASDENREGADFGENAPGVYLHGLDLEKANNYVQFTPLCNNGTFWGVKWEVRTDRADRVP